MRFLRPENKGGDSDSFRFFSTLTNRDIFDSAFVILIDASNGILLFLIVLFGLFAIRMGESRLDAVDQSELLRFLIASAISFNNHRERGLVISSEVVFDGFFFIVSNLHADKTMLYYGNMFFPCVFLNECMSSSHYRCTLEISFEYRINFSICSENYVYV